MFCRVTVIDLDWAGVPVLITAFWPKLYVGRKSGFFASSGPPGPFASFVPSAARRSTARMTWIRPEPISWMNVRASAFETCVSPSASLRLVAVFVSAARTRLWVITPFWACCTAAPAPLRRAMGSTGAWPAAERRACLTSAAEPVTWGPEKLVPETLMKRLGSLMVPPPVLTPPRGIVAE